MTCQGTDRTCRQWTMIDDNNQTLVGDGEMQTSRKMGWKWEWEMGPEIELDREAA